MTPREIKDSNGKVIAYEFGGYVFTVEEVNRLSELHAKYRLDK